MTHRPWLLLLAALTVTVPGALAVLAVLGHDHVAGETAAVSSSSFADSARPGPVPEAPAKTRAPVRNAIAAVQRMSGAPVTVDGTLLGGDQVLGLRLLTRAARASEVTSYQGTELTSQAGVGGEVSTVSQVWHSGGGLTLTQTAGPDCAVVRSPAAIFGLTRSLVRLLGAHYVAVYRGTARIAGRPAALVEVYRFDGSLAARFWLDQRTLIPLRRDLFDAADRPVGEDALVSVRFGAPARRPAAARPASAEPASAEPAPAEPAMAAKNLTVEAPAVEAPAVEAPSVSAATAEPAWITASSPAALLASLAGDGWRPPAVLPDGLALYRAASTGTGTAEVIDLEYSDGLSVVSLFIQRGTLATDMTGWRPTTLGGHPVYVSGRSVTWSWHGLVATMITDAPPATVAAAVETLPRSAPAGVVGRFGRGLDRLAHLVDPFQ